MASAGPDSLPPARRSRALLRVLAAAALLPWLVLPIVSFARRLTAHTPSGDLALLELGVLDALGGEQLLGPYSQYGFRHPGPLLFYVLALPYRLSSVPDFGIFPPAVALLNVACGVGLGFIWLRHNSEGDLLQKPWAAAVLAAFALYLGPYVLSSPWSPNVTILPLLLTLSALAAAASGRVQWLPIATLTGTFCVQTHVSHALSVAIVGLGAVAVMVLRRHFVGARRVGIALAVSAVGGVLLWLPPLMEQAQGRPGNLSAMVRFTLDRGYEADAAAALAAIAGRLAEAPLALVGVDSGPPFSLVGADERSSALVWLASGCAVLLLIAVAYRARRWRPRHSGVRSDLRAAGALVCLAATVAALIWALLIEPPVAGYLVRWSSAVGVVGLLALAPPWPGRARMGGSTWVGLISVLLLVLAVRGAWTVARFDLTAAALAKHRTHLARAVGQAALAAARASPARRVAVRFEVPQAFLAATTVAAQLVKEGYPLAVDPTKRYLFGSRPAPSAGDLQLWVDTPDRLEARQDMKVLWQGAGRALAQFEPLPPADEGLALGSVDAAPYLLEGFGPSERRGEALVRSQLGARSRLLLALETSTGAEVCLEAAVTSAPCAVQLVLDEQALSQLRWSEQRFEVHCARLPEVDAPGVHQLSLERRPPTSPDPPTARRDGSALPALVLRRLTVRAVAR